MRIFLAVWIACIPSLGFTQQKPSRVLYVAPGGNDAWSGSLSAPNADNTDGPVATLEGARDRLRELRKVALIKPGPIHIRVDSGKAIERTTAFTLGPEDSGSKEMPIVYATSSNGPKPGKPAVLTGGKKLDHFGPISKEIAERLASDEARAHVVACDLKAAGITDYGTLKRLGFGMGAGIAAMEVFADGKPLTLARWPNDDWARIAAMPAGKDGGKFTYDGDRPGKWKFHDDIWVHGYWTWDWADSSEKVASINVETKEISTVAPHGVYGYKQGARYYVFNVLEELDRPGEYCVDRATGTLYVWPPDNTRTMHVSLAEQPMFKIDGASYIAIRQFTVEYARGAGAVVTNGNHIAFQDCTFRNLGDGGVSISNCADSGVVNCEMYNLGAGGVSISGGDRAALTPARLFARNNEIHDYGRRARTYTSAVQVDGVGNTVANNLIYDAPHMAIGLGGNDHIIEYNEIHHVCMETHDAGAFYMGRDWTQRGNVVRYNFMHQMGSGDVQAIYLDDWTSGVMVYGNICHGARRGVLVGGGRDNIIDNNIFINCGAGVHIDQRGLGWAKNYFNGQTPTLFDRMKAVNGDQPPYTDKYPELKTLLNDEPVLAKGNKVIHNINVGDNFLDLIDGLTEQTPYIEIKDNFTDGDPRFRDAARHDYRLKSDSPAFAKGFKELPFEKMGRNGPSVLR